MIISIQSGMSLLKEQLEQKGYKVVFNDENTHAADAYIYAGRERVETFYSGSHASEVMLNYSPPFSSSDNISHGNRYSGGVIEINAAGKSVDEIERLLLQKKQGNFLY